MHFVIKFQNYICHGDGAGRGMVSHEESITWPSASQYRTVSLRSYHANLLRPQQKGDRSESTLRPLLIKLEPYFTINSQVFYHETSTPNFQVFSVFNVLCKRNVS